MKACNDLIHGGVAPRARLAAFLPDLEIFSNIDFHDDKVSTGPARPAL
jgi:hypothetical protein